MKIGIIGGGTVGRATARAFIEHVDEVRVYDVVKERCTHHPKLVLECDLVFVCLPTPQKQGELTCDVSVIEDFFGKAVDFRREANFVLRSTVPIGTTRKLREKYNLSNLVHSPEFLTARCAVQDAQMPARNIVGIINPNKLLQIFEDAAGWMGECGTKLWNLYHSRFPGVPIHIMTSDESEAVKLFQNSFFAVKVAFWNECRALSDKLGMDWERVLKAVLADGRIGHSHTKVPGPDGKRGFSGTCLPKDLANLVQCMKDAGSLTFSHDVAGKVGFGTVDGVCQAAYERNLLDRGEKDATPLNRSTTLSDSETWERLNVDRLQLDKGISIGESMPERVEVREGMVNPFDQ